MRRILRIALFACALAALPAAASAATVTILNLDGANEGFNDPTPASPVGGNPGTTIGAQRLYVFQYAANIWGSLLPSAVPILVGAHFDPQSCTATSGVLGSAGPTTVHSDFANAPFPATWYHQALANKLAGSDQSVSQNDIAITFNSSVGGANCLPSGWYYGVDGNEGTKIELLPVVLHEMGHGLGFSTTTNGQTGTYLNGKPGAFDHFLYDDTQGLHWNEMTSTQRAASGINCQNLVWDGAYVTAAAPSKLGPKPILRVNSPAAIAGDYNVGLASFGPPVSGVTVTGTLVLVNDGVGVVTNGCEPFVNAAQVNGHIALLDRGACTFTQKVLNAQAAGAIAVVVADSVPGCPPAGMGGSDPSITIPSVRVTQSDGAILKANIALGVNVTIRTDPALMAGADGAGRVEMYSPQPYQGGSSVSHWDTSAFPDLLMEPALNTALSSDVDLTLQQMKDIGWFAGLVAVNDAPKPKEFGIRETFPNPVKTDATIRFTLPRDEKVELAVFDARGRLVNRLLAGSMTAGVHAATWNGMDGQGRRVPAGAYFYRLTAPGAMDSKKLVMVW